MYAPLDDSIKERFQQIKQKYVGRDIVTGCGRERSTIDPRLYVKLNFAKVPLDECYEDLGFLVNIIKNANPIDEVLVREAIILEELLGQELFYTQSLSKKFVNFVRAKKKKHEKQKKPDKSSKNYAFQYLDINNLCHLSESYLDDEKIGQLNILRGRFEDSANKKYFSVFIKLTKQIIDFVNNNLSNIPFEHRDVEDTIVEIMDRYD